MRFLILIFILNKCQANMCEGASQPLQVGSLNRHYRELYDQPAKILCSEFYQKHHNAEGQSVYFSGGAESVIYKCSTDEELPSESKIPNETILKIYLGSSVDDPTLSGYNWTEMELMDQQLTEQKVRYPVYEWVSMTKPVRLQGKFEQFLPNKQDYKNIDLEPLAISEVAKRLAELHGATVSGVDQNKHKTNMWANTYRIEYHIRSVVSFMNEGVWPGRFEQVLAAWQLTEDQFWAEVRFIEKLHQDYYDKNPETAVMCHNDIHRGNVMRNLFGDIQPKEVILVDFDAAQYGYRMWDMLYFCRNFVISDEKCDQIIVDYFNAQTYDENLTLETLQTEALYMKPYSFFQKLTFKVAFCGDIDEEYARDMKDMYNKSIAPFGRTLPCRTLCGQKLP